MKHSYEDILKAIPMVGRVEHGETQAKPLNLANWGHGPFGVVFQNPYITLVVDPVLFPSLAEGSHLRIIQGVPGQEIYGVVVLVMRAYPDREPDFAWVRQWRHALQGWCVEAPRGGVGTHEMGAVGALREVREETGIGTPDLMVHLGNMANDSGISSTRTAFYVACFLRDIKLSHRGSEERETINDVFWAPMSQWLDLAHAPVSSGRPAGGLDLFTAGAYGLLHASGRMQEMYKAWTRVFDDTLQHYPLLSPEIRDAVALGKQEIDVRLVCRTEEEAKQLCAMIPFLSKDGPRDREVIAKDLSLLALSWLAERDEIDEILPL